MVGLRCIKNDIDLVHPGISESDKLTLIKTINHLDDIKDEGFEMLMNLHSENILTDFFNFNIEVTSINYKLLATLVKDILQVDLNSIKTICEEIIDKVNSLKKIINKKLG
jgi:hypothetical protein